MDKLVLACLAFSLIHLFVAGSSVRQLLINVAGRGTYFGLFSIASLGSLVWMILSYNRVVRSGAEQLWNVGPAGYWVALVFMFPAVILVIVGLLTKSPTAVMQEKLLLQGNPAKGILRISRHPFLSGVAIWSAVHIFADGDMASLAFFGTFFVVVVAGARSIDHKRYVSHGESWRKFTSETSIAPFGAILQGRNSIKFKEMGWPLPLAVAVYAAFVYFHVDIFGVAPFPGWVLPF